MSEGSITLVDLYDFRLGRVRTLEEDRDYWKREALMWRYEAIGKRQVEIELRHMTMRHADLARRFNERGAGVS